VSSRPVPPEAGSRRPFVIMLHHPRPVRARVFHALAAHYAERAAESDA